MSDYLYRISLAVLPRLYVWLSTAWFSTCRLTLRGERNLAEAVARGAVIVPFWHYSIFYMFHHLRKYPAVVLVSASRDGEYIARIAKRLKFETVRGSSHQGGMQALKSLLRSMKAGKHVGIVADGSQGPARVMQPGAVYLASKTGFPVFPIAWAAERCLTFGSWDRTVLPLPFSRIVLRYGPLLHVPAGLDDDGIEKYRVTAEKSLNDLYSRVWAEFDRESHDGGSGRRADSSG